MFWEYIPFWTIICPVIRIKHWERPILLRWQDDSCLKDTPVINNPVLTMKNAVLLVCLSCFPRKIQGLAPPELWTICADPTVQLRLTSKWMMPSGKWWYIPYFKKKILLVHRMSQSLIVSCLFFKALWGSWVSFSLMAVSRLNKKLGSRLWEWMCSTMQTFRLHGCPSGATCIVFILAIYTLPNSSKSSGQLTQQITIKYITK